MKNNSLERKEKRNWEISAKSGEDGVYFNAYVDSKLKRKIYKFLLGGSSIFSLLFLLFQWLWHWMR